MASPAAGPAAIARRVAQAVRSSGVAAPALLTGLTLALDSSLCAGLPIAGVLKDLLANLAASAIEEQHGHARDSENARLQRLLRDAILESLDTVREDLGDHPNCAVWFDAWRERLGESDSEEHVASLFFAEDPAAIEAFAPDAGWFAAFQPALLRWAHDANSTLGDLPAALAEKLAFKFPEYMATSVGHIATTKRGESAWTRVCLEYFIDIRQRLADLPEAKDYTKQLDSITAGLGEINQKLDRLLDRHQTMPAAAWHIPAAVRGFFGRQDLLAGLDTALAQGHAAAIVAVNGLGGVGKTQLALEYARTRRARYTHGYRFRAEQEATLLEDLAGLGRAVRVVVAEDRDLKDAAARTLDWLNSPDLPPTLVVYDNAPDAAAIRDWLPASARPHVIVTSRDTRWRETAHPLEIRPWPVDEAADYLMKRTGLGDAESARAIAALLGGLPLAMAQAAGFVANTPGATLASYLELLGKYEHDLLDAHAPDGHRESVTRTFGAAIESLRARTPEAVELLSVFAFLAPDDIPETLFDELPEGFPAGLGGALANPVRRAGLLAALRGLSLLDLAEGGWSVHRLVQSVARLWLGAAEAEWAGHAVSLLNRAFRYDQHDLATWKASEALVPHAQSAAGHAERLEAGLDAVGRLWNDTGLFQLQRALLSPAKAALESALRIDERVYGPDHRNVATLANNLATIFHDLGDLPAAREWTERALRIGERVYGPDHPNVARDASNLGQILQALGDLPAAREWTERALRIGEHVYGPDHPTVAIHANNLGQILQDLGDLPTARTYLARALDIFTRFLGPGHPNTRIAAANLRSLVDETKDG
ncbi:MAG: tetratricopeptide repeat protein [Bryobacteraceae bacterium]